MPTLDEQWLRELKRSRVVVLADRASYIHSINVPVCRITDSVAGGVTDGELQLLYPGLTYQDIRACLLFLYLRAVGQV